MKKFMEKTCICKWLISLLAVMSLLFTLALSTFAADYPDTSGSHEVGFESLTKEEYIKLVMERTDKTRDEVVNELNASAQEMLEKYGVEGAPPPVAPFSFDITSSEYIGDGVRMYYGYVYFEDTYAGGLKVRSECPASYAQHHYGAAFSTVETSAATLHAASSGQWVLESTSCQAYQDNATTVRIQYSAIIDIVKSEAVSLGVSLEFFNGGVSASMDTHLREHVSNSNSYSLPVSA